MSRGFLRGVLQPRRAPRHPAVGGGESGPPGCVLTAAPGTWPVGYSGYS